MAAVDSVDFDYEPVDPRGRARRAAVAPASDRKPQRASRRAPLDRATIAAYEERLAAYEERQAREVVEPERPRPARSPRRSRTARTPERAPARRAERAAEAGIPAPRTAPRRDYRTGRDGRSRQRKHVKRRPTRRRVLIRRVIAAVVGLFLLVNLISYASAMLSPSNVSFGVRSVEWLRGHGFAWLVNDVEQVYYSLNAPSKGGPALKKLPSVGSGTVNGSGDTYKPPPIAPVVHPALPGEGVWRRTGPLVGGVAPVLVTTFRPDPSYPQLAAGVAWIDHTRSTVQLYPGRYEPPAGSYRGPMEVPPSQRSSLLATFNSAFKLEDSGGGFAALGHTYAPLKAGLATIVGTRDGGIDVRAWNGGSQAGSDVVFARQNLPLILNNGRLNPNLSDGPEWGATLGNAIRVWRSAVGVDARGNLMYAAANDQTVSSLAQILQRAGAVRAMELDINYEWVSFNWFAGFGASDPTKMLPGMDRPPTRYLTPDDRDFFAVFAKP